MPKLKAAFTIKKDDGRDEKERAQMMGMTEPYIIVFNFLE